MPTSSSPPGLLSLPVPSEQRAERILVCVSSSPTSRKLLRAASQIAAGFHGEWTALTIETPGALPLREKDAQQLRENLLYARELGAQVVHLVGRSIGEELIQYAVTRNFTKIIVGKPAHPHWRDRVFGSLVEDVVRGSGNIDVHVIQGSDEQDEERPPWRPILAKRLPLGEVAGTISLLAAATLAGKLTSLWLHRHDILFGYLLVVVMVSYQYGRRMTLPATLGGLLCFHLFIEPPYLSLNLADSRTWMTSVVFLLVARFIGHLTASFANQAETARSRQKQTELMHEITSRLGSLKNLDELAESTVRILGPQFHAVCVFALAEEPGGFRQAAAHPAGLGIPESDRRVVEWVISRQMPAGALTSVYPEAQGMYFPITRGKSVLGVVGLLNPRPRDFDQPETQFLLAAIAGQIALAIDGQLVREEAQQAELRLRAEELRTTLLSSVSHDLRTPLATITGAAGTLLNERGHIKPDDEVNLLEVVVDEAERLNVLVRNLLDVTRLESGARVVHKEWIAIEELIGSALHQSRKNLKHHPVKVNCPESLPLVEVDPLLMQQLFVNLIENAVKYSPPGSEIHLSAGMNEPFVIVRVRDTGPGIPPGMETAIFEKFVRGDPGAARIGTGLGLTICHSIMELHGGGIAAHNHPEGGAEFSVSIPCADAPPMPPKEEE